MINDNNKEDKTALAPYLHPMPQIKLHVVWSPE